MSSTIKGDFMMGANHSADSLMRDSVQNVMCTPAAVTYHASEQLSEPVRRVKAALIGKCNASVLKTERECSSQSR